MAPGPDLMGAIGMKKGQIHGHMYRKTGSGGLGSLMKKAIAIWKPSV